MVRYSFPQAATGSAGVNTNFPPQSGAENISPPVGGTMQYQDLVIMEFEDLEDMDYEQ